MVAVLVLLAGCSSHGRAASTSTGRESVSPQGTSTVAQDLFRPGCGSGFHVTPTGGDYSESAVLARVARQQKTTIPVTLLVSSSAHFVIKSLSLLIGPSSVGTDPLPALRDIPIFHGSPTNDLRLSATFSIKTSGSYVVLAYGLSTSPCGQASPITSAQPIGYVVVT